MHTQTRDFLLIKKNSAPTDRDVGIFDTVVALLSRSACTAARRFTGARDVEGQVGGRWKVEGAEEGSQGVSGGSRRPTVQYMR